MVEAIEQVARARSTPRRSTTERPSKDLVRLIAEFNKTRRELAALEKISTTATAAYIATKPKVPLCIRYAGPWLTKGDIRFEYVQHETERCHGEDVSWLASEYWLLLKDPTRAQIAAEYNRANADAYAATRQPDDHSEIVCDLLCDIDNLIFDFAPKSVADVRALCDFAQSRIDDDPDDSSGGLPDGFVFTLLDWMQRFFLDRKHA